AHTAGNQSHRGPHMGPAVSAFRRYSRDFGQWPVESSQTLGTRPRRLQPKIGDKVQWIFGQPGIEFGLVFFAPVPELAALNPIRRRLCYGAGGRWRLIAGFGHDLRS